MAFIPLPGGIRVALNQTLDGQSIENIYHVTTEDTIDAAKLLQVAACFGAFAVELYDVLHPDIVLQSITLTDVSVADGIQDIYTTGLPLAGSNSNGGSLPNNVAIVASLRTGFSGRSRRGRNYYAGIPEGVVTNNTISGTMVTAILVAIGNLIDCLQADDNQLVVASYVSGGVPRTTALATPVTVPIINTTLDSQRRRLPGRGS